MTLLTTIINTIIALTLLNVWLIRYNKATSYRGGTANSMKEEFAIYGLPRWFMFFIGSLKIILAALLIAGIWFDQINLFSYLTLSLLMLGAILMHLKVKDPIFKSIPALTLFLMLVLLLGINL